MTPNIAMNHILRVDELKSFGGLHRPSGKESITSNKILQETSIEFFCPASLRPQDYPQGYQHIGIERQDR
jgi:hypothetical protein